MAAKGGLKRFPTAEVGEDVLGGGFIRLHDRRGYFLDLGAVRLPRQTLRLTNGILSLFGAIIGRGGRRIDHQLFRQEQQK